MNIAIFPFRGVGRSSGGRWQLGGWGRERGEVGGWRWGRWVGEVGGEGNWGSILDK